MTLVVEGGIDDLTAVILPDQRQNTTENRASTITDENSGNGSRSSKRPATGFYRI
jgi:hypothetical protein